MIKPISRTTLSEEMSKQMIEMVRNGEWIPGEKIPGEIELSKAFQVSRNTVREALKSLEISGIIEAQPGRGTFLSIHAQRNIDRMELMYLLKSGSSFDELMDTRLLIEPHLGQLAAERANDEDIEVLERIMDECREAIDNGNYTTDHGLKFHMHIAVMSKNLVLAKFLHSITEELYAQRLMFLDKYVENQDLEEHIKEHEKILEAVKRRDSEAVKKYLYEHIHSAMLTLKEEYARSAGE